DAEFVAGVEEELRRGLASAALLLRRFGRDVNFLNAHAVLCELFDQPVVHAFHVGHCEIAAADAGLIGNDEQLEAGVLQSFQRLRRAGKKDNLIRVAEIILVLDEGPVAIQENSATHKAPKPKSQAPKKSQIQSSNDVLPWCACIREYRASFAAWSLEIFWCLEFGVWSFIPCV